eukprot:CAMPEP_0180459620 /NCGR_PEP_ID=MMETSP1036_2-20121128/22948_1 /TAXON_ID=632150 /ORGANISM="Azadinium spinosum, Strain 3D9" /LENGTH=196 /DNA_ID=CAMNT_0022466297 /DNA_START=353 /DNA_END=944 /DNA_ORIENTATION=+
MWMQSLRNGMLWYLHRNHLRMVELPRLGALATNNCSWSSIAFASASRRMRSAFAVCSNALSMSLLQAAARASANSMAKVASAAIARIASMSSRQLSSTCKACWVASLASSQLALKAPALLKRLAVVQLRLKIRDALRQFLLGARDAKDRLKDERMQLLVTCNSSPWAAVKSSAFSPEAAVGQDGPVRSLDSFEGTE